MPARTTHPVPPARPRPAWRTALLTAGAWLVAVAALVIGVGSMIIALVSLAEPVAMFDALADGASYLWSSVVELVWPR